MAAQRQKVVQAEVHEEEEEETLDEYVAIEKLAEVGVNAGDIKKAREAGYHTIQSLQMNHSKHLKDIKGLSEAKIDKLLEASYKFANVCAFRTATHVSQKVLFERLELCTCFCWLCCWS